MSLGFLPFSSPKKKRNRISSSEFRGYDDYFYLEIDTPDDIIFIEYTKTLMKSSNSLLTQCHRYQKRKCNMKTEGKPKHSPESPRKCSHVECKRGMHQDSSLENTSVNPCEEIVYNTQITTSKPSEVTSDSVKCDGSDNSVMTDINTENASNTLEKLTPNPLPMELPKCNSPRNRSQSNCQDHVNGIAPWNFSLDDQPETVIVKIIPRSVLKNSRRNSISFGKNSRDLSQLLRLKHENIVPLKDIIDDPLYDKVFLVYKHEDFHQIAEIDENAIMKRNEAFMSAFETSSTLELDTILPEDDPFNNHQTSAPGSNPTSPADSSLATPPRPSTYELCYSPDKHAFSPRYPSYQPSRSPSRSPSEGVDDAEESVESNASRLPSTTSDNALSPPSTPINLAASVSALSLSASSITSFTSSASSIASLASTQSADTTIQSPTFTRVHSLSSLSFQDSSHSKRKRALFQDTVTVIDECNVPKKVSLKKQLSFSKNRYSTLNPYPEKVARKYFRDIAHSVAYLHSRGITHLDFKPSNILLDATTGSAKLFNVGLSFLDAPYLDDEEVLGTPSFMCPERCASLTNESGVYEVNDKKGDIWSLGVLLYLIVVGRLPFRGRGCGMEYICSLYHSIQKDIPEIPSRLSSELQQLLKSILEKRPDKRITIEEILSHPWVTFREDAALTEDGCRASDESPLPEHKRKFMNLVRIFKTSIGRKVAKELK